MPVETWSLNPPKVRAVLYDGTNAQEVLDLFADVPGLLDLDAPVARVLEEAESAGMFAYAAPAELQPGALVVRPEPWDMIWHEVPVGYYAVREGVQGRPWAPELFTSAYSRD